MSMGKAIATIAVIAIVTAALRFLPFLIFGRKGEPSDTVKYLGRVLPFAIMGMLVIYCYRGVELTVMPFGLPELIAGVSVVLLHLWRRNTLISIVGGTAIYMLLIRFVF